MKWYTLKSSLYLSNLTITSRRSLPNASQLLPITAIYIHGYRYVIYTIHKPLHKHTLLNPYGTGTATDLYWESVTLPEQQCVHEVPTDEV